MARTMIVCSHRASVIRTPLVFEWACIVLLTMFGVRIDRAQVIWQWRHQFIESPRTRAIWNGRCAYEIEPFGMLGEQSAPFLIVHVGGGQEGQPSPPHGVQCCAFIGMQA